MQQMGIWRSLEVLNMNLNIWFDITSKYLENICVIFSVAVGILSERLTDTSCQDYSLRFYLAFL